MPHDTHRLTACAAVVLWLATTVVAPGADKTQQPAPEKSSPAPPEKPVVTSHSITLGGTRLEYTATAGKIAMRTDAGKVKARIFFVAYTKKDVPRPAERPVTFCFNGGPGSSSVWLHLGMAGPWKVKLSPPAATTPPPFQLEQNDHSLLDVTDLVFIDPVSTGYSRPEEGEKGDQFHGYDEDIQSVGQFIHDYTTRYGRWPSPKFVMGESYGGLRAAGLSGYLRSRYHLELNGLVFVSGVVSFQTIRFDTSNDLPYVMFLPTYTATAWYHHGLPEDLQRLPLAEVVARARRFALGPYASALMQGDALRTNRRRTIVEKLSRFTGLSQAYVEGSDLRVPVERFAKELLRDRGATVGRFDSRYLSVDRDVVGESYSTDASADALFGPFAAAMNEYLRDHLKYSDDRVYEILTGDVQPWNYRRFQNRFVDASRTLRTSMTVNPYLKVFAACGYYDLATPGLGMQYTRDHLGLAAARRENFAIRYYEGGHMMYVGEPSLKKLHHDLAAFYQQAQPPTR